ncbi:MAG: branched-chain amino acid ABC transporter permease [Deltaproteobacteria bacterium]|nr:branched-chain amino acid ABC transporter permease [Deltaproteobacteria bacterium]MBW1919489.1 branched-chain amino acid ABC transporter permease [Deltaproteobacteria bacterium]MBW1934782.1 branched-chain amino acid ABC transporter permease [Deltaproteobacteria bacterium]MBW1976543.1 branched-chain amino acid ABC transporter permease [Deltaproteobacteria bacterium]MBW2044922.1 branched-chain amino acid ABC transporter permease [Deltaproteobacteria bacterium]
MIVRVLDIGIAGLLLGGIYALIAVGLTLQYGVARVLNIAHGEFIMIGAFITWSLYIIFGINPLLSLAICGPAIFTIGFLLYRTLFRRLRISSASPAAFEGSSMLACFGLLFIIQNLAILIWGADIKGYSYLAFPIRFWGQTFAANRLITLGFALAIGLIFYFFLTWSRLGKAIRAAAQDAAAAELMGINIDQVLALCFGFGALMAGLGGTLLSMSYKIQPTMGLEYTVIALIVIVLGGLGSIPGSFIGGLLLGLVGSIVTYIQPGLSLVAYYLLFMLLLLAKPTGILGK